MRRTQFLALLIVASAAYPAEPQPLVELRYEQQADERCASAQHQPIKPEWSRELQERLPELNSLWRSVGPSMVEAVTRLTTKPFAPPNVIRLTLCETPSNSFFGVTVNMRYALGSFTVTPVPLRYKIDTVFHEILHEFITRNIPSNSALLTEHSSESLCVRNHLHLLALQKAVLLHTNDSRSLEQVIAIDSELPSGCYKRAWNLINSSPGTYQRYIAELSSE
jgi:hypothetical protein